MGKTKRAASKLGQAALVCVAALVVAAVFFSGSAAAQDVQQDEAALHAAQDAKAKADAALDAAEARLKADEGGSESVIQGCKAYGSKCDRNDECCSKNCDYSGGQGGFCH